MHAAAALFARHDSLEAKVGSALASWPEGSLDRLEQLAKLYPESAVVQLHLGLARLWANQGDPTRGVAGGARGGAGHAVRDRRGEPPPSAAPPRAARVHPVVRRLVRDHAPPARRASSRRFAERRSAAASESACCTASGSSASAGPSRPRGSSSRAARAHPSDVEALGRRRCRAVRQGRSRSVAFGRLGPLTRTYPERADRALPPRRAPPLDGPCRGGASGSSGSPRARSPARRSRARPLAISRRSEGPLVDPCVL